MISVGLEGFTQSPRLPIDPLPMLLTWDYDRLVEELGEGEELVETWNNQPYLAGYRYSVDWFNRPARAGVYFDESRILRLTISIDHITDRSVYQTNRNVSSNPSTRDSIWRAQRIQDSTIQALLKKNPEKMDSIKRASETNKALGKENIRLDSIRCDSIINELNSYLGLPLFRDSAPPTEKNFLYHANWINKGYSCGLRDYPDHLELTFSISYLPTRIISEFALPDSTCIIQRGVLQRRNEKLDIYLLGGRDDSKSAYYTSLYIMIDRKGKGILIEQIPDPGDTGYHPYYQLIEITGDTYPELLISTDDGGDHPCRNYIVYSLSYGEPILLWNFADEEIFIPDDLLKTIGEEVSLSGHSLPGTCPESNARLPSVCGFGGRI